MGEETRVQLWRRKRREEGKEAVSLWLSREDRQRLDELAHTRHCSPSAVVSYALSLVTAPQVALGEPIDDTFRLRELIREELAAQQQVTRPPVPKRLRAAFTHASRLAPMENASQQTTTGLPQEEEEDASQQTAPTSDVRTQAVPAFDATKYALGKLCPREHAHGDTGKSLLRLPGKRCLACEAATKRERRLAQHRTIAGEA